MAIKIEPGCLFSHLIRQMTWSINIQKEVIYLFTRIKIVDTLPGMHMKTWIAFTHGYVKACCN
jgi:hypothetical protein